MMAFMHPPPGSSHKLRRFNRKYGTKLFLAFVVLVVIGLVVLLMWMLANPDFRSRG
jgi:hypothetical protein